MLFLQLLKLALTCMHSMQDLNRLTCFRCNWNPEQVDEFAYRLFKLALSVLMARMRAEQAVSDRGYVGLLFPDMLRPRRGRTYPW